MDGTTFQLSSIEPKNTAIKPFWRWVANLCGAAFLASVSLQLVVIVLLVIRDIPLSGGQPLLSIAVFCFAVGLLGILLLRQNISARFFYGVALGSFIIYEALLSMGLRVIGSWLSFVLLLNAPYNAFTHFSFLATLLVVQGVFALGLMSGGIQTLRAGTLGRWSGAPFLLGCYWLFHLFMPLWGYQLVRFFFGVNGKPIFIYGEFLSYFPLFIFAGGTAVGLFRSSRK